jgi:hypothetical protein
MIINENLILSTLSLPNFTANGNIGTASATVDIVSSFNIAQTTAGISLTLPTPTNLVDGQVATVVNSGTTSFNLNGKEVMPSGLLEHVLVNGTWVSAPDQSKLKIVNVVATTNTPLTGLMTALPTTDGVPMTIGKTALLPAQTTGTQNGRYVLTQNGSNYEFVRANDTSVGEWVYVLEGMTNQKTDWKNQNTGTFVDNTTILTYTKFSQVTATSTSLYSAGSMNLAFDTDGLTSSSEFLRILMGSASTNIMQFQSGGSISSFRQFRALCREDNGSVVGISQHTDQFLNLVPAATTGGVNLYLPSAFFLVNGSDYTVKDPTGWCSASRPCTITAPYEGKSTTGAGTISLTTGSQNVTGTGTSFSASNIGQKFTVGGIYTYTIATVTNATTITISTPAITTLANTSYLLRAIASVTAGSPTLTGIGTDFLTSLAIGHFVTINGVDYTVLSITSDTVATLSANAVASFSGGYTSFMPIDGQKSVVANSPKFCLGFVSTSTTPTGSLGKYYSLKVLS